MDTSTVAAPRQSAANPLVGKTLRSAETPLRRQSPMVGLAVLWIALARLTLPANTSASEFAHPRLYFTTNDLSSLRADRFRGERKLVWRNLAQSADWCLTRTPRAKWIAPVSPDPRYENLYDRFYAIMGDLAITEHLTFAYALSGDAKYGEAARRWTLASCRAWQREADDHPDSGKAYAVSRLLKGVAVGYDAAFDRFTEAERAEIRDTLARVGRKYFTEWFNTPAIAGPGYHTHHAIVEWGSFGVVALALLGEVPEAQEWLDATTRKFEEQLLPNGLAPDGAQTEGATFWASTMQYRLFFMDPLRRVTGKNLFQTFEQQMNADLALASIAARKRSGLDEHHANVVLEPSYGQLDYYAPILLALAREYRRPIFQHLARWDESLGGIQHTRYVTPHGEELLFELGGYAYLWCDTSVRDQADEKKLSWHFPSADETYARVSWQPGDLLVGVRKGEVVIHAGGQAVVIEPGASPASTNLSFQNFSDERGTASIRYGNESGQFVSAELDRRAHKVILRRQQPGDWQWWCHDPPVRSGNTLKWKSGVSLRLRQGEFTAYDPAGHAPKLSVGNGLLDLLDPARRALPLIKIKPSPGGETELEIFFKP